MRRPTEASAHDQPVYARAADLWAAAAAFAVGFLVYANTLGHGFVWDDLIWLEQRVRFYRGPLDAFFEPADLPGFPGTYRPLTFASFWLDQMIWWRNPSGYHLTSVLLHAANSALVFLLARALACALWPALLGAMLFAVHPIHTESVAWITTRVDVLAATFVMLTVLAFLRCRERPGAARLATVALCTFAAATSKEVGATTPLLLLFVPRREWRAASSTGTHPDTGKRLGLAASACGVLACLALRLSERAAGPALASFDLDALVNLLGAFGFYVGRALLPFFGFSAYIPEPPAGLAVWLLAATGISGAVYLALARPTDGGIRRLAAFWFCLTLAPSLLVVLADISVTAVAERYLYLPTVALSLLLASALPWPPRTGRDRAAVSLVGVVLVVFAVLTVARNRVWQDETTLWQDVTRTKTGYALPYLNLGLALDESGRIEDAERAYRAALATRGNAEQKRATYINLGQLELGRANLGEAARLFELANEIGPHASAYYGLGRVARTRARQKLGAGETAEAAEQFARARASFEAALAINQRHYLSHFALASVLYQTGDVAGAVEHYRRVVELAGDTETGRDAAEALSQLAAAGLTGQ